MDETYNEAFKNKVWEERARRMEFPSSIHNLINVDLFKTY